MLSKAEGDIYSRSSYPTEGSSTQKTVKIDPVC